MHTNESLGHQRNLVYHLDAEGLLMPELPAPDDPDLGKWAVEDDVVVYDMAKMRLGGHLMPGWVALVTTGTEEARVHVMPAASMRQIGLCLLAAADASEEAESAADH